MCGNWMSSTKRARPVRKRWSSTRRTGWPMPYRLDGLFMGGEDQLGREFVAVPDRVLPDLVRRVVVRPEHVGHHGIAVHDFQPDAAALPEAVGIRLDTDVESIHLARLERLRLGVRVIWLHPGAALRVERTVRRAQPALGHH